MISINVFMDIMYIHRRIARGGTWLNVGLSKVAKSLLHWSLRHQPAVYIMTQCTKPATPAVIVCCELSPYGFATGGRFRLPSHTLEKSRSNEERPTQAIFRQTQTDASRHRWA